MHSEARRRVHLDDAAPGFPNRLADARADKVDPGDVQADDQRCPAGNLGIVEVDLVGSVNGSATRRQIGGGAKHDNNPGRRDAIDRKARPTEIVHHMRIDLDPGHDLFMASAAARVAVHLFDQVADGVHAIADDVSRHALRNRYELAVHHQDAVVAAGKNCSSTIRRPCSRARSKPKRSWSSSMIPVLMPRP